MNALADIASLFEEYSLANQVLFTPNPSSYSIEGLKDESNTRLKAVFVPATLHSVGAAEVSQDGAKDAENEERFDEVADDGEVFVVDADARWPWIPCIFSPSLAKSSYLVVHFHGTGGDAAKSGRMWFDVSRKLRNDKETDVNVLSVEYPGYGICAGRASEATCLQVATCVIRFLLHNLRISPSQLIISGRSMGSGVATRMATLTYRSLGLSNLSGSHDNVVPFAALVLVSPFLSIGALLKTFPAGRLLSLLLKERFRNSAAIGSISCDTRLLVYHGAKDALIPWAQSEKLFGIAAISGRAMRSLVIDPEGDHHSIPLAESTLADFIKSLGAPEGVVCDRLQNPHRLFPSACSDTSACMASIRASLQCFEKRRKRTLYCCVAVLLARLVVLRRPREILWATCLLFALPLRRRRFVGNPPQQVNGTLLGLNNKLRLIVLTVLCRVFFPVTSFLAGESLVATALLTLTSTALLH